MFMTLVIFSGIVQDTLSVFSGIVHDHLYIFSNMVQDSLYILRNWSAQNGFRTIRGVFSILFPCIARRLIAGVDNDMT
jgi:hypothetical protein